MIGFYVWTKASLIKGANAPQRARVIALDKVNQNIRLVCRFMGDGVVRDVTPDDVVGFEIEDGRIQVSHKFKASRLEVWDWGGQ